MRIAELYEPHRFRLINGSIPEPGPGEVQVKVDSVGICGSDLHYFAEGGIPGAACVYPMVIGHEPAGVVLKTGPGVTGWSAGDRVALEPAHYCYHCEFCMTGRHNLCEKIRFLSTPGEPGFFRDRVNLPVTNVLALPAGLSLRDATLFEPLAVILHSMKFASIAPGDTAVVFGAGPIGLLTVSALKLSGCGRLWVVDPVAHRREIAHSLGANETIDPGQVDPVNEILRETCRRGVDVSVDCAARGDTINQCLHATRRAGRVVLTGIYPESRVPVEFHVARNKELSLFNVRRSNHESETALKLLDEYPGRFASIITHARPIEEVQTVFETLEHYSDGIGKAVVLLQ